MLKELLSSSEQIANREVALLRERLNQAGKEREEWFERKETLKKRVAKLISQTKQLRETRDKAAKELGDFSKARNEVNAKVAELYKQYNALYYERRDLLKKHNITQDPDKIKRNIEYYETLIETEAYTFKKEKKLMEYIKGLKKTLAEAKVTEEVSLKMNLVSKEIEENKKKATEFHNKSNEAYYAHKKARKDFNIFSKKITAFNKLQERAFEMFVTLKEQYSTIFKELKEKTKVFEKETKKIKKIKHDEVQKKRNDEDQQIKDKQKEAEDKLKNKKKLTTEDLMAFQGKN